jgi:hypothetical protein
MSARFPHFALRQRSFRCQQVLGPPHAPAAVPAPLSAKLGSFSNSMKVEFEPRLADSGSNSKAVGSRGAGRQPRALWPATPSGAGQSEVQTPRIPETSSPALAPASTRVRGHGSQDLPARDFQARVSPEWVGSGGREAVGATAVDKAWEIGGSGGSRYSIHNVSDRICCFD